MKIAFVGKGGSGKTSLTALFSQFVATKQFPVWVFDADINQHLNRSLGQQKSAEHGQPLSAIGKDLKKFLVGTNPRVDLSEMINSTPPGAGAEFVYFDKNNDILNPCFTEYTNGIKAINIGDFSPQDLGVRCYHAKTANLDILLSHILDRPKELVITDMTAGADAFASGIFTKFDIIFLVVEPTLSSVDVFHQYEKYGKDFGISVQVIANKIMGAEDIDFIKEHISAPIVAEFSHNQTIRQMSQGKSVDIQAIDSNSQEALNKILNLVLNSEQDWETKAKHNADLHIRNCEGWGNQRFSKDISSQIDPDFSYLPYLPQ